MVPKFLQPYLASYDLSKMDVYRDKEIIITEILNKGDEDALKWLTGVYSKNDIRQAVLHPLRGMWLKKTLDYWLKIFEVDLDKKVFKDSILNLNA